MRILITTIIVLFSLSGLAQTQITSAEYFVGPDPGLGNATPIDITAGQSVTGSFDVSVASLSNGLHYLHVRAQNSDGTWSLYMRQPFYVADFDVTHEIAAAEYFIGADPGIGNGEPLSLTPGNTISETFAIPADDLTTGLHFLHIRTQTTSGRWSLYARKQFYVQPFIPDPDVVEAEYFIGVDPGIGNGQPLSVTLGNTISETFAIPVGEMTTGLHHLHIRTRAASGKWSLYARKQFYVQPYIPDLEVVEAEYFIDVDPGIGNGIPLEISSAHEISENFSIVLSDTLSLGDHLLYIRVKNEVENWSFYALSLFTIDESSGVPAWTNDFNIYPNPATSTLNLETGNSIPDFVRIIDMNGKVVMTPSPQNRQFDIQHLVPGTYLIQIGADGHLFSERLVKQ